MLYISANPWSVLDGESHKGAHARCRFRLRPHGEGEKTAGPEAVACRHSGLGWSKIATGISASYVSPRPKEGPGSKKVQDLSAAYRWAYRQAINSRRPKTNRHAPYRNNQEDTGLLACSLEESKLKPPPAI